MCRTRSYYFSSRRYVKLGRETIYLSKPFKFVHGLGLAVALTPIFDGYNYQDNRMIMFRYRYDREMQEKEKIIKK